MILNRLFVRSLATVKMIHFPASERNKEPILKVLKSILPSDKPVVGLEIASGTGQHCTYFADNLVNTTWQPTDLDPSHVKSIDLYAAKSPSGSRILKALQIDVANPFDQWPEEARKSNHFDFVLAVNMTQVSPFHCTSALFQNSSKVLKNGGNLFIYGPFAVDGVLTPESNVRFDMGLKSQNPEWGVRDVSDLKKLASSNSFSLIKMEEMPANNKMLIFEKRSN